MVIKTVEKLKRHKIFTHDEKDYLESKFTASPYVDKSTRDEIAQFLNIPKFKVLQWFANKRSTMKIKYTNGNSPSVVKGPNDFDHSQVNDRLEENTRKNLNRRCKMVNGKRQYHERSPSPAKPSAKNAKNAKRKCYNSHIRTTQNQNYSSDSIDNRAIDERERRNLFDQDQLETYKVEFYNIENELETNANGNNYSSPQLQQNSFDHDQTEHRIPDKVQVNFQHAPGSTSGCNPIHSLQHHIGQGAAQNLVYTSYPKEDGFEHIVQTPDENYLAIPQPSMPYQSQFHNLSTEVNTNHHLRKTDFGSLLSGNEENISKDYFESMRYAIHVILNVD